MLAFSCRHWRSVPVWGEPRSARSPRLAPLVPFARIRILPVLAKNSNPVSRPFLDSPGVPSSLPAPRSQAMSTRDLSNSPPPGLVEFVKRIGAQLAPSHDLREHERYHFTVPVDVQPLDEDFQPRGNTAECPEGCGIHPPRTRAHRCARTDGSALCHRRSPSLRSRRDRPC